MHLPMQSCKGARQNFTNIVRKTLESHLNSFGFDLVYFGDEVLHIGGISAAHEEGKIDESEGFVGILLEDYGHIVVLHFDDLRQEAGVGFFFPGWGDFYDAGEVELVFFHLYHLSDYATDRRVRV